MWKIFLKWKHRWIKNQHLRLRVRMTANAVLLEASIKINRPQLALLPGLRPCFALAALLSCESSSSMFVHQERSKFFRKHFLCDYGVKPLSSTRGAHGAGSAIFLAFARSILSNHGWDVMSLPNSRFDGSFSSNFDMIFFPSSLHSTSSSLIGSGSEFEMSFKSCSSLMPSYQNGFSPEIISYITTPKAQLSTARPWPWSGTENEEQVTKIAVALDVLVLSIF